VGEIAIDVTADIGPLVNATRRGEAALGGLGGAADRAARGLNQFGNRTISLGKSLSAVTAGITAATGAAFAFTKGVAAAGDETAKAARGAGVSGQYFQEMRFALEQVAAVSESELASGMTRVTRLLGEAQNGSKTAIAAFEQIGISQSQIAAGAVTTEQAFDAFIAKLSETTDPAAAAAIATQILGRSGADLGPKLSGAAGSVASLRDRARELGIVMSDDALAASEQFGDQLDEIQKGFDGLKIAIANELLPVFTNVLLPAIINKVIPALSRITTKIGEVIDWFADLPAPVQEAAAAIGTALGFGGPILVGVGLVSKAIGGLVAATGPIGLFIAAATLLVTAWTMWGDEIKAIIGQAADFISTAFNDALAAIQNFSDQAKQAVTGAVEWMRTKFDEFMTFVKTLPSQLLQIGSDMIQGLIDGIKQKWEELKAMIFGLTELLPQWMRDLLEIQSPSRVFQRIGNEIGAGLAQGIAESQEIVRQSVENIGGGAVAATDNTVSSILDSLGTLFGGSKKFAIAQALINAWTGASEALKLPFPKNLAAFAKVLATGLGAVRNIKSVTPGGGGGGGRVASGGGGQPAPAPLQTLNFTITNDPFGYGERFARSLAEQLNTARRNGANIVATVTSS
jgi:hypothetical protein